MDATILQLIKIISALYYNAMCADKITKLNTEAKAILETIDVNHRGGISVGGIESTIENFEPRANLIAVYVNPYPDQNGYNVKIVFSTINNPQPITFDVLLTRVR